MKRLMLGSLVALIVAASSLASVGSASPTVTKQRISILITFHTTIGKEPTFQLVPLTKGPLKRDSGTFVSPIGSMSDVVLSHGQRVRTILGQDDMTGYQGTFKVNQSLESVDVGGGYHVETGTWSLQGMSGAYAGLTGEGRFTSVRLPSGKAIAREEGWVTKT